jgi:hypothetical protein
MAHVGFAGIQGRPDVNHAPGALDCPAYIAGLKKIPDHRFGCSLVKEFFDAGVMVKGPDGMTCSDEGSHHASAGPPIGRGNEDHLKCLLAFPDVSNR